MEASIEDELIALRALLIINQGTDVSGGVSVSSQASPGFHSCVVAQKGQRIFRVRRHEAHAIDHDAS